MESQAALRIERRCNQDKILYSSCVAKWLHRQHLGAVPGVVLSMVIDCMDYVPGIGNAP